MSEPIDLVVARREPDPNVVSLAEELLERARSGEIRSVALAMEGPGFTSTAFELGRDGNRAHLNFALDGLKLRLLSDD